MSIGMQCGVYDCAVDDNENLEIDPCRAKSTFSGPRLLAFVFLFLTMLGGGFALLLLLSEAPYRIQLASAVSYTAGVMLYGFAKNRIGIAPYLFTCPVVVSQYPRLLKRHAAYLTGMVAFETIAMDVRPHLSAWWLTASGRNMPPFVDAVIVPCLILAFAEIVTNRAVLERAHVERFGNMVKEDDSESEKPLSIFSKN